MTAWILHLASGIPSMAALILHLASGIPPTSVMTPTATPFRLCRPPHRRESLAPSRGVWRDFLVETPRLPVDLPYPPPHSLLCHKASPSPQSLPDLLNLPSCLRYLRRRQCWPPLVVARLAAALLGGSQWVVRAAAPVAGKQLKRKNNLPQRSKAALSSRPAALGRAALCRAARSSNDPPPAVGPSRRLLRLPHASRPGRDRSRARCHHPTTAQHRASLHRRVVKPRHRGVGRRRRVRQYHRGK